MKLIFSGIFVLLCVLGYGQTTRDVAPPTPPPPQYQNKAIQKKTLFKKKKKKASHFEDYEDFERRMKDLKKQKKKEAKMAKKPQYTDPLYFGHKKPPVKRPPGEQKWCKVCRMKH